MTKSSVDRKRSKYGEKYSLRFHKRLKTYDLTCNDEIPHLIAKFVETDGDLAMRLFERLESNYKENEQLKLICKDHRNHANDFKADCVRLEKENEQLKHRIKKLQNDLDNYSEIFDELNGLVDENENLKSKVDAITNPPINIL